MRTITNLFLLNLAVSDLLLGVLCIPFTLIGTLLRHFVLGEVMCKLLPFLQGKPPHIFAPDEKEPATPAMNADMCDLQAACYCSYAKLVDTADLW